MRKNIIRVCRHCGQLFTITSNHHFRSVCYDPECKQKEADRLNELKRFRNHLNYNKLRGTKIKKRGFINKKIEKRCLNCDKIYKDYGPYNRGLCPACKQLEIYGETDWGTI